MEIIGYYQGTQPIVNAIPTGWKVDRYSSSPINGYVYIHNGRALSRRMLAPTPKTDKQ